MYLLALLFLTTAHAAGGGRFALFAGVHKPCWNPLGCLIEDTHTTCNICVKNGYTQTLCNQGVPKEWWGIYYWEDTYVFGSYDTIVWTDCDDALAFPFAHQHDSFGQHTMWGEVSRWGSKPKAWCLSTDQSDANDFHGRIISNTCYRALILRPDGSVHYYLDQSYTPGRRMLNGLPVPTNEEVKECELDPTRDNEECIALIDRILDYELRHTENFVELTDESEEDDTEDDESSTDDESSIDDESSTDDESSIDDESSTDDESSENDVSSAETVTELGQVSSALRRLLKA